MDIETRYDMEAKAFFEELLEESPHFNVDQKPSFYPGFGHDVFVVTAVEDETFLVARPVTVKKDGEWTYKIETEGYNIEEVARATVSEHSLVESGVIEPDEE